MSGKDIEFLGKFIHLLYFEKRYIYVNIDRSYIYFRLRHVGVSYHCINLIIVFPK